MTPAYPPISVVIPTADRPQSVARAVASVLAADYPRFEVLVVDQSADGRTGAALAGLGPDERLRYCRVTGRGYSRAINHGVAQGRHDLIALTDDDCTVAADWLRSLAAAFAADPRVGLVCGDVVAAVHDPAAGYLPARALPGPALLTGPRPRPWSWGMGACMGLRRGCWEAVDGLDELIGPGARLRSGADLDLGVRVLQRGHGVYETPAVRVGHHGYRPWPAARRVLYDNWFGVGAICAKLVRAGRGELVRAAWRDWGRGAARRSVGGFRRPPRLRWPRALVHGYLVALPLPVDPITLKWRGERELPE